MSPVLIQMAAIAETNPTKLLASLIGDTVDLIIANVAQLAGCSPSDLLDFLDNLNANKPIAAMLASATGCSPADLCNALT